MLRRLCLPATCRMTCPERWTKPSIGKAQAARTADMQTAWSRCGLCSIDASIVEPPDYSSQRRCAPYCSVRRPFDCRLHHASQSTDANASSQRSECRSRCFARRNDFGNVRSQAPHRTRPYPLSLSLSMSMSMSVLLPWQPRWRADAEADSVPDQRQRQAEDGCRCIVRLDGERCDIAPIWGRIASGLPRHRSFGARAAGDRCLGAPTPRAGQAVVSDMCAKRTASGRRSRAARWGMRSLGSPNPHGMLS